MRICRIIHRETHCGNRSLAGETVQFWGRCFRLWDLTQIHHGCYYHLFMRDLGPRHTRNGARCLWFSHSALQHLWKSVNRRFSVTAFKRGLVVYVPFVFGLFGLSRCLIGNRTRHAHTHTHRYMHTNRQILARNHPPLTLPLQICTAVHQRAQSANTHLFCLCSCFYRF